MTRMIGTFGRKTLNAVELGLRASQLEYAKSVEIFDDAHEETMRILKRLQLDDLAVPKSHETYLEEAPLIGLRIGRELMRERSRLKGEVMALPLFFLAAFAVRASAQLAFGEMDDELQGQLDGCLDDLGIERDVLEVLRRGAKEAEFFEDEAGTLRVRQRDVFLAAMDFLRTVIHRLYDEVVDQREAGELLQDLLVQLAAFRDEARIDGRELERMLEESQSELAELFAQLRVALGEAGCDREEARALTEDDPERLWSRILRWSRGKKARDAAEAALWSALEFAPGGTRVQLGTRIAHAIRSSTK
jgi:hypothetical protein